MDTRKSGDITQPLLESKVLIREDTFYGVLDDTRHPTIMESAISAFKKKFEDTHRKEMSLNQNAIFKAVFKNLEKDIVNIDRRSRIINFLIAKLPFIKEDDLEMEVCILTSSIFEHLRASTKNVDETDSLSLELFSADTLANVKPHLQKNGDWIMVANTNLAATNKLFKTKLLAPTKIMLFLRIDSELIKKIDFAICGDGWIADPFNKILSYGQLSKDSVFYFAHALKKNYGDLFNPDNLIVPNQKDKTVDPNYINFTGVKSTLEILQEVKPKMSSCRLD